jgi:hypothetical protein
MPEGLSPSEVGKELAEHRRKAQEAEKEQSEGAATEVKGRERWLTITEAILTFNAWFTAYVAHNKPAMRVAENRFRPVFLTAFKAWLTTDPFTNPNAPKGPTYMPQYKQPELAASNALDKKADIYYALGEEAGGNADSYVRTTVYLATVLFLVGISGHFKVRSARLGLVGIGGVILVFASISLILAPKPPV